MLDKIKKLFNMEKEISLLKKRVKFLESEHEFIQRAINDLKKKIKF